MAVAEINTARVQGQISVTDDLQGLAGDGGQFSWDTLDPGQSTYNGSSSPPGVYYSSQVVALVAGAKTLDLTALLGGLQGVIDATGKKLQVLRIRGEADGTNAALTISEGAANPYELFGAANPIVYPAGCTKAWTFEFDDKLADVAAGAKNISLAGTGTDSYFIEIILG